LRQTINGQTSIKTFVTIKTKKMINKITLIGRIGQIDIKDTKAGEKLTNFSVATSDSYKDKSGEWQEKTQWHRCTLFKEFKGEKGDMVYIEGKVEYREHEGKYYTDIICSYARKINGKSSSTEKKEEDFTPAVELPYPTNGQIVAMKIKIKRGELFLEQIQEKFNLTTEQFHQLKMEEPLTGEDKLPF
jgi:single-strand DNA-binding protein